jgi:hypothetical protein
MNMTPNDPRIEASTCKSSGTQPGNDEAWITRFKPKSRRKRHQTPTCKCTQIKNHTRSKPGGNWAEPGLGRRAWADRPSPFWAWFDAPFDLAASRAICSPLVESHEERYSSSATEEQRREGHHSGEQRVEMVD